MRGWRAATVGLVLLAAIVATGVRPARAAGIPANRRAISAPVFYAIANDAPSWMQVGGSGRTLCTGTQAAGGSQAGLQAAVDACAAAGGGRVKCSPGTFWMGFPTANPLYGPTITQIDDDDAKLTADPTIDSAASTASGISSVLHGVATWDEGTFADWAVDDILRYSGGADASGSETLEQNVEYGYASVLNVTEIGALSTVAWDESELELEKVGGFVGIAEGDNVYIASGTAVTPGWYTVDGPGGGAAAPTDDVVVLTVDVTTDGDDQADLATEDALLLNERLDNHSGDGAADYTGVDVDKVIASVTVPPGVMLEGDGVPATAWKQADGADCPPLMLWQSSSGEHVRCQLKHIYFHGRQSAQSGTDDTYRAGCPGLVVSPNAWDTDVTGCAWYSQAGDGIILVGNGVWGWQQRAGWIEYQCGAGIVCGDGNHATFYGVKNIEGGLDSTGTFCTSALWLREGANQVNWIGGMLQSNTDWAVRAKKAWDCRFTGATIDSNDAASEGGMYFDSDSYDMIVTGCQVEVQDTNASAVGIDLTASGGTVVTGCKFHDDCPTPFDLSGYPKGQVLLGNLGPLGIGDHIETVRLTNTDGTTITIYRAVTWDSGGAETMKLMPDATAAAGTPLVGVLQLGLDSSVNQAAQGEDGYVIRRGQCLGRIDNEDNLANGAELAISKEGDGDGQFGIAAATDMVWAFLVSGTGVTGGGTAINAPIVLLEKPYTKP